MNGIQEVSGSIPLISTKLQPKGWSFSFILRVFQANKQQRFDPVNRQEMLLPFRTAGTKIKHNKPKLPEVTV